MRLEVIAQPGAAPDALICETQWPFSRLLQRGRGDPMLSLAWNCFVVCTPEFSEWWNARLSAARPTGFFLEVLS